MFIIFLIIDIWTLFAIPRSFIMFSIVSDDAPYMPRALIERFMKVIFLSSLVLHCYKPLSFKKDRVIFHSFQGHANHPIVNQQFNCVSVESPLNRMSLPPFYDKVVYRKQYSAALIVKKVQY